ncbi:hypothetical protein BJ170DRAFT_711822 [Xylariales sp. AK1849]|nr:hypothetical protein BJ170DRAFT_711822 [Xylariales sp. AK1849]
MSGGSYLALPPTGQLRYGMDAAPTRRGELIAMGVATTVVAATTVGLRLFTRLQIMRGYLGVDDYAVLAALVFSIAMLTVWFRWCTFALVAASISYSFTYVFLNIFPCQPIAATWDYTIDISTCVDAWTAYYALSISNIFMDVLTLLLPIPIIVPLQMEKRQKMSLLLLFATGAFVCAITVRRTVLIPSLQASRDRPWDVVDDYLLSYSEINAGIICASVPVLKPLFIKCLPGRLEIRTRSRGTSITRGTYGSNTVIEQNRARRQMQNASIKLMTIDEGNRYIRKHSDDEGIHLWNNASRDDAFDRAIVIGTRPIYLSNPIVGELRGDGAGHDARAEVASPRPIRKSGITVTRETTIHYEREYNPVGLQQ